MQAGVLAMSASERDRLVVLEQRTTGLIGQAAAAERLDLSVRQLRRLEVRYAADGAAGLVSRQRGRASNNRLCANVAARIDRLLADKYPDFGASLAAEKLLELDKITVSRETVRRRQIALGLARPKRRRARRVHRPRDRRPRFGELIQIDGSRHDWFEDRGPGCTLIVFIDDATGRLTGLLFCAAETTNAYQTLLRGHILAHGCPLALYSDRHGIFRVNAKEPAHGDGLTEFQRTTRRLGIELICATTPQAKGRVERANQTLQDRLIKEMRLRGISNMAAANAYAAEFMAFWNKRFAVPPAKTDDAHRHHTKSAAEFNDAFAATEERIVSKNLTFRLDGNLCLIKTSGPGTALCGVKIDILRHLDGTIEIRRKNKPLNYTVIASKNTPTKQADSKTIDQRIDDIIKTQTPQPPCQAMDKSASTASDKERAAEPDLPTAITNNTGHSNFAQEEDISTLR